MARPKAERDETDRVYRETSEVANAIGDRVNGLSARDEAYVCVMCPSIYRLKAAFQREAATTIEVSYRTKDPKLAESLARVMHEHLVGRVECAHGVPGCAVDHSKSIACIVPSRVGS